MRVKHFKAAAPFRKWLETNHARANELWFGFYRKDSGKGGITYNRCPCRTTRSTSRCKRVGPDNR